MQNDYKSIYVRNTGEEIQEGYVIHHIDFNKKNNHIENLVAIPKRLHGQYHYFITLLNQYFILSDAYGGELTQKNKLRLDSPSGYIDEMEDGNLISLESFEYDHKEIHRIYRNALMHSMNISRYISDRNLKINKRRG